jgi:acetyl-CoA synthetase
MPLEQYLTPQQIAEALVVPVARVAHWLRSGRLRGIKAGRDWRIPESAFKSFVDTSAKAASK